MKKGNMKKIKTIIGLFIPVRWEVGINESGKPTYRYETTFAIGGIPLGLIMVVVSVIISLIIR